MNAELLTFVMTTLGTGVTGNLAYDGLKQIVGGTFPRLLSSAKNNNTVEVESIFQTLIEQNIQIKNQLEQLQSGQPITFVNQTHSGSGDNVVTTNVKG